MNELCSGEIVLDHTLLGWQKRRSSSVIPAKAGIQWITLPTTQTSGFRPSPE